MIALDTNLLVYAHRADSPWHAESATLITRLGEGRESWAIPWHCLHEFFGIVTHPGIYDPPTALPVALAAVNRWVASPSVQLLAEGSGYWERLRDLLASAKVVGPMVHDARIAALCLHHGVAELWTADRDFGRFPGLKVRNPLVTKRR